MPYKKGKSGYGRHVHALGSHGEYPYVPVELFAQFSAAQGTSSLSGQSCQTSIATLRAHEHQRAADVPSLPQASCKNMLAWCDGLEPAPELACSDGGRRQMKGCARAVERMDTGPGRGCTTAPSSSPGVLMSRYIEPKAQAMRSLRLGCSLGCSLGRAVLAALCFLIVLSRPPTETFPDAPIRRIRSNDSRYASARPVCCRPYASSDVRVAQCGQSGA
jgi:hypothetical protein